MPAKFTPHLMKKTVLICLSFILWLPYVSFGQTPAPATPSKGGASATRPDRPNRDRQGERQRQRRPNNNDAFYQLTADSKPMEGVPQGKFSEAKIIPSDVFPGTQHTYWVYVPAQYDPTKPTAVMVFNDGQAMMAEPGDVQAHRVMDNLIFRREIPVMLGVFINPGRRPDQPEPTPRDWGDRTTNRADEYNPPNENYGRVIVEELLPALKKEYNISPNPELHGIMGASSGGCAAFAVAWFRPDDFRKVITFVGSFTDIRGEHIYPELVAASEKKGRSAPVRFGSTARWLRGCLLDELRDAGRGGVIIRGARGEHPATAVTATIKRLCDEGLAEKVATATYRLPRRK